MNLTLECLPCIVGSFAKLLKMNILPPEQIDPAIRRFFTFLSQADYQQSPPALGREMHHIIREILQNPDPYREVKEKYNRMMLDLYPDFKEMITGASDPFDTALRLAVAGNVIDYGPQHQLDIMETVERVMGARFDIDDSQKLKKDLETAQSLLYIGDNCGEIVMDKLFLEHINVPVKYFAVRESPVINDITAEDAKMVGIDRLAEIISTGDNAPGAIWEYTSDLFREKLHNSDVVIAKGQGNLEGLSEVPYTVYFLLVTKCDVIAKHIGTRREEFVVKRIN
ncbi:MAG: DUF89 family protein [Calditrichaeota bacterium]|nr:DUF89 family protein [Calditrichota bacterium]